MRSAERVIECDARVDEAGRIVLPPDARDAAMQWTGGRVRVRVSEAAEAAALRARGIGDAEVDLIAATQLEPRSQVVKFLLAEGACAARRRTKGRR